MDSYVEALLNEIKLKKDYFRDKGIPLTTIYIGGGTPSLLSATQLSKIVSTACEVFEISLEDIEEFTMEVNPDDVTPDYLATIKKSGINRLSMGVQSFSDEDLKWMNRRHNSKQAIDAFYNARAAGFDNISLDLIFGYELLTMERWNSNLQKILEMRPEHISSYQLSIEPKSKLGSLYEKGCYNATSDEMSYREYQLLQQCLNDAGYVQYEISNFSLPGKEAIHNSAYWNLTPYLGLGPAAHSFNGENRFWNCSNLNQYILQTAMDKSCSKQETLSIKDKFNETIMLSLRKRDGLNPGLLREKFGESMFGIFERQSAPLLKSGNLVISDGKIKIPQEKLFLSDGIIRDLFI
jgi:oxygen-independent coproporphyrinogen-3 oxidase